MRLITPQTVIRLLEKEVFVFGSNLAGRHGKGAALTALQWFGAKNCQGIGLQGQSYAIPTKGLRLEVLPLRKIYDYVQDFRLHAISQPQCTFLVTEIGCGLAGYSPAEIAPLFGSMIPDNVALPLSFWEVIDSAPTSDK